MTAKERYAQFLQSPIWKGLRARAIQRDGGKCVRCGTDSHLQVHHIRYRRRWELTRMEDLETLCRQHHRDEHKPVPKRGWFWTAEEDLHYTKWMMSLYIKRIMKGRKLSRMANRNIQTAVENYPANESILGYVRRIRLFSEVMGVDV